MKKRNEQAAALLLVCVFALCSVAGCKGKTQGSQVPGGPSGVQQEYPGQTGPDSDTQPGNPGSTDGAGTQSGNPGGTNGDEGTQPGNPGSTDGAGTQPGNPGGTDGESIQPGMNGVTVAPAKQTGTDYPNGTMGAAGRLMRYGKGLYYDNYARGLHYVDLEKNIDLVLCNKPECRHDGNAFCVATNKKYARKVSCIYGGRLLTAVVEQTDTQYLCKLLSIALDGSELEELTTFYTLEKTGDFYIKMGGSWASTELFVHRGKAVVYVEAAGQENLDDTVFSGNFVIDLKTKEVSPLGEVLFGKDVMPATNLQACGDSIFYSVPEGKTGKAKNRHTLYEYNIKDKTVQKCSLQRGFQGTYAVMEDGTVYYYRTKKTEIWKYDRKTRQSELALELKRTRSWTLADGTVMESCETFDGTDIATDGTYIYIQEASVGFMIDGEIVPTTMLHVYDKGLEEVAWADIAAAIRKRPFKEGGQILLYSPNYEFDGEDIYLRYGVEREGITYGKRLVYKIKRSDLLLGNPVAEWVYDIGYDIGRE